MKIIEEALEPLFDYFLNDNPTKEVAFPALNAEGQKFQHFVIRVDHEAPISMPLEEVLSELKANTWLDFTDIVINGDVMCGEPFLSRIDGELKRRKHLSEFVVLGGLMETEHKPAKGIIYYTAWIKLGIEFEK